MNGRHSAVAGFKPLKPFGGTAVRSLILLARSDESTEKPAAGVVLK